MILAAARDPVGEFLKANPWIFPLFFVALWVLVGTVVGRWSGWYSLAERYRANTTFQGETWRFQSAQMRYLSHYNNCLTFGADPQGLSIAMFFILRAGHPPLFIPWGELELQPNRRLFVSGYELRFRQVPGVYMWVWAKLGEKILRASQGGGGIRTAPPIG